MQREPSCEGSCVSTFLFLEVVVKESLPVIRRRFLRVRIGLVLHTYLHCKLVNLDVHPRGVVRDLQAMNAFSIWCNDQQRRRCLAVFSLRCLKIALRRAIGKKSCRAFHGAGLRTTVTHATVGKVAFDSVKYLHLQYATTE